MRCCFSFAGFIDFFYFLKTQTHFGLPLSFLIKPNSNELLSYSIILASLAFALLDEVDGLKYLSTALINSTPDDAHVSRCHHRFFAYTQTADWEHQFESLCYNERKITPDIHYRLKKHNVA